MSKLNVIVANSASDNTSTKINPKTSREQVQARFDREWLTNPTQFNPMKSIMERVRVERLMSFAMEHLNINGAKVADLGCGYGVISKKFRDLGAHVDAVDISKAALAHVNEEQGIRAIQSLIPHTHLDENDYDLVVCTGLIGHIQKREHRLLINELARLVKKEGTILFSTQIDIYSEDALERLISLLRTELEIQHCSVDYHSKFIRIKNFFAAPKRFSQASKNPRLRKNELEKRHSIWAQWFKVNSSKIFGWIWKAITPLSNQITHYLNQSRWLLLLLEKISCSDACISHLTVLAKKKPIEFGLAIAISDEEVKKSTKSG